MLALILAGGVLLRRGRVVALCVCGGGKHSRREILVQGNTHVRCPCCSSTATGPPPLKHTPTLARYFASLFYLEGKLREIAAPLYSRLALFKGGYPCCPTSIV